MSRSTAAFEPATTMPVLESACRNTGLDPTDARLLRHHTNAVYFLPRPDTVVKITRPAAGMLRVRRAVQAAGRLAELGVPATTPYAGIAQPVTVHDHHVTFWTSVKSVRAPLAADLAYPLLRLHNVEIPSGLDLPKLDPFAAIARSLDRATILDEHEHTFLIRHAGRLAEEYAGLEYESAPCIIHGDAHHSNALVDSSGAVLADWESVCIGHAEWDLTTLAVHCARFNHPPYEYDDFATHYNRDVRDWPGYATLRAVRELRMITTNSWKSQAGSPSASEVHRRIKALREGIPDQPWILL